MLKGPQQITVELSLPGERLDAYLRTHIPSVSRGSLQKLIDTGDILVNGKKVKPTHAPKAGDVIEINWPEPKALEMEAEEIPLDILFEDKHLLVLNKPPGLVVHPGAGHREHTLVNALLHHCKGQLSGIAGVARPGIVHRLDKDTSGCIAIAKNDEAHLGLSAQFKARTVEKIYHALLCGELPKATGDIKAAIARHPTQRKVMTVVAGKGRDSHTAYRILERLKWSTLVEVALLTGRTHQIRVHFQHLGFPLVGDSIYGGRQNARLKSLAGLAASRQMLHSYSLSFNHPVSAERISCQAPWPEDFQKTCLALRHSTASANLKHDR
ncbi:MAG: RluA family pseudouridine synthase [Verrucomicrobiales bacterium]